MRIKIKLPNSCEHRNINIQNIEFDNRNPEYGLPTIYFTCHKNYEWAFEGGELAIFHDKKGREYFRSKCVRLDYLFYEDDGPGHAQKVRFAVKFPEVHKLGLASKFYIAKILKKACNANVKEIIHDPPPSKNIASQKEKRILPAWLVREKKIARRALDVYLSTILYCRFYKDYRKNHIKYIYDFKEHYHEVIEHYIESTAPP